MRISFLPAGMDEVASARIRVYSLLQPLRERGISVALGVRRDADVIFVQKRVNPSVLAAVHRARAWGALIVYDCDDQGAALAALAPAPLVREIIGLADVVTTNTESYRDLIRRDHGATRVEILPDTFDYYLTRMVTTPPLPAEPLRVLWFGNCGNLRLIEPYLTRLTRLPDCRVVVCTHLCDTNTGPAQREVPQAEFVPWTLATFPDVLRSCHLTLLTHQGGPADRAKSNNRMIASIAWGVPAIVSPTPEYARTASMAGVGGAIFRDADDLADVVEAHRSAGVRAAYLRRAQGPIWRQHAPAKIAARLREIVAGVTRKS